MEVKVEDDELPEGVTLEDISSLPLIKKLQSDTLIYQDGFIRVHPYNQVFPTRVKKYLSYISNFDIKEDDIWICSFPKCGTTWTQEMVWCIKNNLNFGQAQIESLDKRVPFFEIKAIHPWIGIDSFANVQNLPSPRIIKSHFSFEMLPKQCMGKGVKVIYVARNPRDICVSFYNHFRIIETYTGTFEDFAEVFLNDMCLYAPCIPHILSYWNQRHLPNMLFITFEEMKEDLPAVLRKVARFLDKSLDDDDVTKLVHHLSFENMKKNPAVNKDEGIQFVNEHYKKTFGKTEVPSKGMFMRKGEVGNWKEYFTNELLEKFKAWEKKALNNSDLKFVFEQRIISCL